MDGNTIRMNEETVLRLKQRHDTRVKQQKVIAEEQKHDDELLECHRLVDRLSRNYDESLPSFIKSGEKSFVVEFNRGRYYREVLYPRSDQCQTLLAKFVQSKGYKFNGFWNEGNRVEFDIANKQAYVKRYWD
jgi:hypothetical protein